MHFAEFNNVHNYCGCISLDYFLEMDASRPDTTVYTSRCTKCDGANMCIGVVPWTGEWRCYINLKGDDAKKIDSRKMCTY